MWQSDLCLLKKDAYFVGCNGTIRNTTSLNQPTQFSEGLNIQFYRNLFALFIVCMTLCYISCLNVSIDCAAQHALIIIIIQRRNWGGGGKCPSNIFNKEQIFILH